jgi:acyl-coenzyme A synthetase/AMP-(fatty) acid ligase
MNFKDIFLSLETHYANQEAFIEYPAGKKMTYGEFNNSARSVCASYRRVAKVRKGDRIAFTGFKGTCDLFTAVYGSWKIGAVPVCVHARVSDEEKAWMINQTEAKVFIYPEDMVSSVTKVREIGIPTIRQFVSLGKAAHFAEELSIDDIYKEYKGADEPNAKVCEDDDLLICYTSGSTGRPSGIVHKHGGFSFSVMKHNYPNQYSCASRQVDAHAPTTIGSNNMSALLMMVGATHVLMRFDARQVLKCLGDEKITHFGAAFTMIEQVLRELGSNPEKYDASSVTHLLWPGKMTPYTEEDLALLKKVFPKAKLCSWMASTECSGGFYFTSDYSNLKLKQYSSPGRAAPFSMVELRDEKGKVITKAGERGEVFVKDEGTKTARVWRNPEDTKARFPDGWWRSKDLAYFDEDGFFYMAGRADNMFKSGGLKVYPEQVEQYLCRHPAIISAVVVPIPHPKWQYAGCAFIRTDDSSLRGEDLEKWWGEQQLPGFMRLREWRILGKEPFPLTGPEKVDRREMKRRSLG